jgi:hypothetical protein
MIAEPMPDFERLRFSTRPLDALAARPSKLPRHRPGEAFLKGPIPMAWLALAARLPGRALHTGLVLWYWAGITKRRVVAPSLSRAEREFGVSRTALARGLAALEHADLVSVDRRAGRKPVVTLLDAPRSVASATDGITPTRNGPDRANLGVVHAFVPNPQRDSDDEDDPEHTRSNTARRPCNTITRAKEYTNGSSNENTTSETGEESV